MIHAQDFSHPPPGLPLRVLLGSVAAAAAALLTQAGLWQEKLMALPVPDTALGWRCAASLVVLVAALLLALCLGLAAAMTARRCGRRAERAAALGGRVLACLPIAALAWGFIGVWTGRFGLPVETLMPTELPLAQNAWQTTVARLVWEYLAPALLLALPLAGEVLHAVVADAGVVVDLEAALHARGVPPKARVWRHHLRQMLPLARARLQGLCLVAPAYLIIVEDVLRFMGWGGWMAQAIRAADAPKIALGFLLGGLMMALLCALARLLPGWLRHSHNRLSGLAWLPWPVWMLGLMVLPPFSHAPCLVIWVAVLLLGSAAWHDVWTRAERRLPLEAAQVLGATDAAAWRSHIAPLQGRMLLAWMCTVVAQTLLWIASAAVLLPALVRDLEAPLGVWLSPLVVSSPQDTSRILADPSTLLLAGGGLALAALCLVQVSRIVQPRPLS